MSKNISFLIFNFLGLQITWAACAYGATHSFALLGAIIGCIYIILHMIFTPNRIVDALTLLSLTMIGVCLDYLNMKLGIISFRSNEIGFIPVWLIILWGVFSLMIPHSLHWLSSKPILASILGGICGSFSYWLGHKLGAITLSDPLLLNVLIYFIEWTIYIPLAFVIHHSIKNIISSQATLKNNIST